MQRDKGLSSADTQSKLRQGKFWLNITKAVFTMGALQQGASALGDARFECFSEQINLLWRLEQFRLEVLNILTDSLTVARLRFPSLNVQQSRRWSLPVASYHRTVKSYQTFQSRVPSASSWPQKLPSSFFCCSFPVFFSLFRNNL